MTVIDLFAGIGGFSLAAHWIGWKTVAFVEKEPYCQKVLSKNFPGVPIVDDIRDYKPKKHAADIICGGFPCQPFSSAGKRKGKEDDRFLWPEMLRVIREVQPTWVVGENVAGILSMDGGVVFEEICASLEDEGYAVQSFVIPAISQGAPHRRDRVWIVGYAEHNGRNAAKEQRSVNKAEGEGWMCQPERPDSTHGDVRKFATNTTSKRMERNWPSGQQEPQSQAGERLSGCDLTGAWQTGWYEVATRLCRVHDGLPSWVDRHRAARLKALGNAIVPQVAYQIFQQLDSLR